MNIFNTAYFFPKSALFHKFLFAAIVEHHACPNIHSLISED
jgi:hypothetical protein